MAKRYSSGFKHYESQKHKRKLLPPIQIGDKFHHLTVISITVKGVSQLTVVCRCECSRLVKTYGQSVRKGLVTACEACMVLEKRKIETAKEVKRLTSVHVDPSELPKREPWSHAGDEASLIAEAEKQDAAQ